MLLLNTLELTARVYLKNIIITVFILLSHRNGD